MRARATKCVVTSLEILSSGSDEARTLLGTSSNTLPRRSIYGRPFRADVSRLLQSPRNKRDTIAPAAARSIRGGLE